MIRHWASGKGTTYYCERIVNGRCRAMWEKNVKNLVSLGVENNKNESLYG